MTIEQAAVAAAKFGKNVYLVDSLNITAGEVNYHQYSIHVDGLFIASGEHSWEECLEVISRLDPDAVRREKVAKLKAELAAITLEPGESDPRD